VAYVILALSAYEAYAHQRAGMFLVGAAVLILLFVGIYSAWDTVVEGREEKSLNHVLTTNQPTLVVFAFGLPSVAVLSVRLVDEVRPPLRALCTTAQQKDQE